MAAVPVWVLVAEGCEAVGASPWAGAEPVCVLCWLMSPVGPWFWMPWAHSGTSGCSSDRVPTGIKPRGGRLCIRLARGHMGGCSQVCLAACSGCSRARPGGGSPGLLRALYVGPAGGCVLPRCWRIRSFSFCWECESKRLGRPRPTLGGH